MVQRLESRRNGISPKDVLLAAKLDAIANRLL